MGNEVCENCGRAIGKLEQAFICKGHVVCKECNKKLSDEPQEIRSGRPRVEMYCPKCGTENPDDAQLCRSCSWVLTSISITAQNPNAQRGKMTKSKILWLAFVGWTVLFNVLIWSMLAFYYCEIATRTPEEQFEVGLDKLATKIWFVFLVFIWFIGALPLFIAAIVTRKDKK
jgi:hypothetical protein